MFATPPCKGQRRLAIVVAAETVPYVIGGSFCVKGKNCALDVCWEGKTFRMICSHLAPLSVMHLYAKDLDDFRSLLTPRGRDSARPFLCGRSDRLGVNATKTISRTHWHCYTGKQRMFESFIMEKLLTATNTFHFEDDGVPSTSTLATITGITNHKRLTASFPLTNSLRSRTFDSSATNCDHWGLIAAIKSEHVKTPRKNTVRKLIGSECRDRIVYNNEVRAILNVDDGHLAQESRHSDEGLFALYFLPGGSARKTSRKETSAGWGFTAMKSYQNGEKVQWWKLVDQCKQLKATDNTAEMQVSDRGALLA